jgi:hypothetical protein
MTQTHEQAQLKSVLAAVGQIFDFFGDELIGSTSR